MKTRTYVVGRDPGCDVHLDHHSVSRLHADIVRLPAGGLHVTDRGSTNGTFVLDNGRWRPVREVRLVPDDHVQFGECRMSAVELGGLCPEERAGQPAGEDAGLGAGRAERPDLHELPSATPARPTGERGGAWMRYAALAVVVSGIVSIGWSVWMAQGGGLGTSGEGVGTGLGDRRTPHPAGTVAVSNQPGCGLFLPDLLRALRPGVGIIKSASWSGGCVDGFAAGGGILAVLLRIDIESYEIRARPTRNGGFARGKMEGRWCVQLNADGGRYFEFEDGQRITRANEAYAPIACW